jgi:hypothetical protein
MNSKTDALSCNLEYHLKEECTNKKNNNTSNQFKFRKLCLILKNKIQPTCSNCRNNLEIINICNLRINKPKAKFFKYNNLYMAEKIEVFKKD